MLDFRSNYRNIFCTVVVSVGLLVANPAFAGFPFLSRCAAYFRGIIANSNEAPTEGPIKRRWKKESFIPLNLTPEARAGLTVEAAESFKRYFDFLNSVVLERAYLFDAIAEALLAKEHVLIVGKAGNGKSQGANLALSNITEVWVDQDNPSNRRKGSSFFKTQMTKETTLAQTHGNIDFGKLSDGVWKRLVNQGMLGKRGVLLDEFFDVNMLALRNVLEGMNERTHSEAGRVYKGHIWTLIAATNTSIPEIFLQTQGIIDPQPVIDRFLSVVWIPKDFKHASNLTRVIDGKLETDLQIPRLTWNQIRLLHDLTNQVVIPEHVQYLLSKMHFDLGARLEALELDDLEQYENARRAGRNPLPPYRATKFTSIRSAFKAGNKLRAYVVLNWIRSNGNRPLVASAEDLSSLRTFYGLGGPEDEVARAQSLRTFDPKEKKQIEDMLSERNRFDQVFEEVVLKFNAILAEYALSDLSIALANYPTLSDSEKSELKESLKQIYLETKFPAHLAPKTDLSELTLEELTPEVIAKSSIHKSILEWLSSITGHSEAITLIKGWDKIKPEDSTSEDFFQPQDP